MMSKSKAQLAPLRAVRAALILEMVRTAGAAFLDDDWYPLCRLQTGLTRAQADRAIDDLAAAGEIVLAIHGGQVVATLQAGANAETRAPRV